MMDVRQTTHFIRAKWFCFPWASNGVFNAIFALFEFRPTLPELKTPFFPVKGFQNVERKFLYLQLSKLVASP